MDEYEMVHGMFLNRKYYKVLPLYKETAEENNLEENRETTSEDYKKNRKKNRTKYVKLHGERFDD